ncbi:MAG: type II toxin-antitoxin system death-on-curing family toxin [Alphaproteobacteria bacterium]|nr:type II toxin-antitoxin system death-on-curing family toxin [Alphaproteobacteria bacterium]
MREPTWLSEAGIRKAHSELIVEHGGSDGIRDDNLLGSALARPRNLLTHGEPTIFALAAAYAFGIARNHPFVDGNKRTALIAIYMFLGRNGYRLTAPEAEAVVVILDLAAGKLGEDELARWIESNSRA